MTKMRPSARMTRDRRAVERRQHRLGDHLVDGADRRLAAAEIEHLVDGAQQRVDLVRAEQHGDAELARDVAHQLDDAALMRRIEADQRLVEQQQLGLADQRLGDEQALALAARQLGERALGEIGRADALERLGDGLAGRRRRRRASPSDGRRRRSAAARGR